MAIEAPDALAAIGAPTAPGPSPAGAKDLAHPQAAGTRRGRWAGLLWRAGRWVLLLSLIGLNAWWFWRDHRPVAGLATIARWIEQHQEARAERALRQRLVRSPHDG